MAKDYKGGEYLLDKFKAYLKLKRICYELTVSHSPEQNGVVERMNRTLMESACSMIAHAGLPDSFWAEAVATAAYVRNRTPTTSINGQWYGRKKNLGHLKLLGCMDYAYNYNTQR